MIISVHKHTSKQTQRGRWAAFDGLIRAQELGSGRGLQPRAAVGRRTRAVARSKGCLGPTVTQTMRRMARRRRRVSPDDDDDATDDGAPRQPRSLLPWRGGTTMVGDAPGAADDDEAAPRRRWFGGTDKLVGGAPGAADDQTVNTETTGTRRQAAQQEEEDDDDDGIDWSKMPPEEVFKRFDTDGSGEIDLEEFKVMLKKLKIHMSSAKAVKYFKICDVDDSGQIDFEEFRVALFACDPNNGNPIGFAPNALLTPIDAFEMFDEDGSGSIDVGDLLLVTQLMRGGDLFERLAAREGAFTEAEAIELARQILDGVAYLHDQGTAHCDLKPSNILVNRNCDVKICDFGFARGVDDPASPEKSPASPLTAGASPRLHVLAEHLFPVRWRRLLLQHVPRRG